VGDFLATVMECDDADVVDYDEGIMDLEDAVRLGLTADSTDADIEKIAGRHYDEIKARGAYVVGSVVDELTARREEVAEQREREAEEQELSGWIA